MQETCKIVSELTQVFGVTSLLDFTGDEITLKVQEDHGKSIGFMFGFLEELKERCSIK